MSFPVLPEESSLPQEADLRDTMTGFLGAFQRRWGIFIVVFLLALAGGLALLALRGPIYQASAILLVPPDPLPTNSIASGDPLAAMVAATLPSRFDAQLQVLQSNSFLAEAMQQAGIVPKGLGGPPLVTVEGQRLANSIEITVEGSDPQGITKLANTMVDLHLERMNTSSNTGFREALELARKEKERASQSLGEAERTLYRFRRANPVLGPSTQREARAGEYAALAAKIPETESSIAVTKSQIENLQVRLAKEPPELIQEKENPKYLKLQSKLDDLKFQRMDLLREFKPTSRTVRDLNRQITQLQRLVETTPTEIQVRSHAENPARTLLKTRLEELQATLGGLQQNHNAVAAQLKAQKRLLADLGPGEIQLDRLIRGRDAAQARWTTASDRLRDLEIRSLAWQRIARTTQAASRATVPQRPSRPLKTKHLAIIGLLALLLASGAVFLLDFLDDRVTSPQTVDRRLHLPVLGQIPLLADDNHPLLTALPADSTIVESYRALRANIGFAAMDGPLRSMIVTSAHHGEGKSTIAVNLAISMAMAGRCVILIDADLRRSSIHRILDLPQGPGLTDALLGSLAIEAAVCPTQVPGLLVVTSGAAPANPADLLSMAAMTNLLDTLRAMADVLVIDTPSCLHVTDAQVLAAQVDGVLLVAGVRETKKKEVKAARDLMDRAYARTIGLVLNKGNDRALPLGPGTNGTSYPGIRPAGTKQLPATSPSPPVTAAANRSLKGAHAASYAALVLFTLVLWFRPNELIPILSSFTSLALCSGVLTLIVFFPSQFSLEGTFTARPRELKLLLLLSLMALLSIPFALDPGEAWSTFTNTFAKAVLIFVVIVNVVRTKQRLVGLLHIALASGCLLSLAALNDYMHGRFAIEGYRVTGALGGMFSDPNDLSVHLVTMTPIALGLLLGTRTPIHKLIYGTIALLMVATVMITYSRGGFLSLVAVLTFFTWKVVRRSPLAAVALTVVFLSVFVAVASPAYLGRLASIFNPSLDPNGSASERQALLIRSVAVALRNPLFGVGMGNSPIVSLRDHGTHNAYTQVAAELGLPALFFYIGFIITPLRRLQKIQRQKLSPGAGVDSYYLASGLQTSLVGFLVGSFFLSIAYYWYVYYLVGYAVCLCRICNVDPQLRTAYGGREIERRRSSRVRGRGRAVLTS